MEIQTNKVFRVLSKSKKRVVSLRGGTRSGKTYNALIWLVLVWARLSQNEVCTIARNTLPSLKGSAMRDFFEILDRLNLYRESAHNKTANEYRIGSNLFEFIAVEQSDRVKGRKRNILFLNEANENSLESFRQLALRTTDKIILDYNPSEPNSWIYEKVETREDCELDITTYKDNPFLEKSVVDEIELLKDADEEYWKIYGLGEIGSGATKIFTHWREVSESAYPHGKGETYYGLDFGYNNPTALVEVKFYDNELYWREMLYQTKLTTYDLIEKLKDFPELKNALLIGDSAEPKTIEEINRAGFKIEPAYKKVKDTIDFVKSKRLYVHSESTNLLREIKRYSWKTDKNGNVLDEVVKFDDHLLDGGRYASFRFNEPVFGVSEKEEQIFKGLA